MRKFEFAASQLKALNFASSNPFRGLDIDEDKKSEVDYLSRSAHRASGEAMGGHRIYHRLMIKQNVHPEVLDSIRQQLEHMHERAKNAHKKAKRAHVILGNKSNAVVHHAYVSEHNDMLKGLMRDRE